MEKEKFIELITVHQNLLYKVCNSYCPDADFRKDLEQEILLQLWNSMDKFDGRVKITTWMYKIALNTAISLYRKDSKRIDKPNTIDEAVFSLPATEYNAEQDERISMIYKLIESMNSFDKALMLLYLDNYKHKEIAEILGLSESNVATKINRIKNNLKERITNA